MRTAAFVLISAALIAAAMMRARTYLQIRSHGAGYLAIAAAGAGLAILLNAPGPYRWFDHAVVDHRNASVLVSHVLTGIGAGAACEMVAILVGTGRITRRIRIVGEGVAIVAMIISFNVAAPISEDPYFFEDHKGDPQLVPYWCIFIGLVIAQLGYVATQTLQYTDHEDRWLGRGLRLIGYGSALSALFLGARLVEIVAPGTANRIDPAAPVVLVAGALLLATGVALPQVGLRADRARSRRRLYPVWRAVTAEYPYVRTTSQRPNLYRSVIEVQDALAEARSHGRLDSPVLLALDALDPRPAEQFDAAVRDLLSVSTLVR